MNSSTEVDIANDLEFIGQAFCSRDLTNREVWSDVHWAMRQALNSMRLSGNLFDFWIKVSPIDTTNERNGIKVDVDIRCEFSSHISKITIYIISDDDYIMAYDRAMGIL